MITNMSKEQTEFQKVIEKTVTNGVGFDPLLHSTPEDRLLLLEHLGDLQLCYTQDSTLAEEVQSIGWLKDHLRSLGLTHFIRIGTMNKARELIPQLVEFRVALRVALDRHKEKAFARGYSKGELEGRLETMQAAIPALPSISKSDEPVSIFVPKHRILQKI